MEYPEIRVLIAAPNNMQPLEINIKAKQPHHHQHVRQLKWALEKKKDNMYDKQEDLMDAKTHQKTYNSYTSLYDFKHGYS